MDKSKGVWLHGLLHSGAQCPPHQGLLSLLALSYFVATSSWGSSTAWWLPAALRQDGCQQTLGHLIKKKKKRLVNGLNKNPGPDSHSFQRRGREWGFWVAKPEREPALGTMGKISCPGSTSTKGRGGGDFFQSDWTMDQEWMFLVYIEYPQQFSYL